MNTNTTGFRMFSKSLRPCALDESSLSIGSVMEKYKHQRVCSNNRIFHGVDIDRSLVLTRLLPTAQVRISAGTYDKLPMTWCVSAPVDRTSVIAWLYKHLWITC